jgi:hypothetical protein
MATRTLFFERTFEPLGYERWHLISEQGSTFSVEHSWSRAPATLGGQTQSGTTVTSAGLFFASVTDELLLQALRRAITSVVATGMELEAAVAGTLSTQPLVFDPLATVLEWLGTCRVRDLNRLITFYDATATLDCACTGRELCSGTAELKSYWLQRFSDPSPSIFVFRDIWPTEDATVLDYTSHNGQPVRSFFYFSDSGRVRHTRCGPI